MLTWADIAKLCVPFIFSLILIWAKHWYDISRERKAKQEFLWRTINQGLVNLPVALGELDKLADAFKNNRIRIVDFDLAANLTDFGNRLGELDSTNAYVYSDYTSQIEIVKKGLTFLKSLIQEILTSSEATRGIVSQAIDAQAKNIKKDLVTLAQRELDVLRTIQRANRKYEQQVINQHSNMVEKAASLLTPA